MDSRFDLARFWDADKLAALFAGLPVGVVVHGLDGRIVSANQAALDIVGLSLDELTGKTSTDPDWQTVREDGRMSERSMRFRILNQESKEEVASLFTSAFSSSEGEQEGRLIGNLASALAARIDNQEVICIGAYEDGSMIGAIFFTRLRFDEPVEAYLLAPVAVGAAHQGRGVGQALINFGLQELRNRSATVAVTYGDPAFYSKVGFQALSEAVIQAPLPLSMPEGWLGQSLSAEAIPILKSRPACVQEFENPDYW